MEQDPRFAFRILVDIANKALSPAINDPTTAVLALDQIHHLLMDVGKRRLDAGQIRDAQDRLRLCYGTPDWTDFVSLAITEIRHYGASNIQVARRLQAMLAHLLHVMPEGRKAVLQQELSLLHRAIHAVFPTMRIASALKSATSKALAVRGHHSAGQGVRPSSRRHCGEIIGK